MAIKIAGTEVINDNKRVLNNESLPDIRPSLLLDFANSKTLDPRITFTRGSTATYWDGKTTAKAEENLIKYSQELDNAVWQHYLSSSVTANSATAPDGTTTADTVTFGTGALSNAYQIFSGPVSGTEVTVSCYAKVSSGTQNFRLKVYDGSDKLSSDLTATTAWQRFSYTVTTTGTQSQIGIMNQAAGGAGSIQVWGVQMEVRSSATAYTATTTSPIVKYQPVLQTAASGEARFDHDPVTGESKGLLIEEARTNLLNYSGDIGGINWSNTWGGGTIMTRSSAIAPDGTKSATETRAIDGTGDGIAQTPTVSSGTTYTLSLFIKNIDSARTLIDFYDIDNSTGNNMAINWSGIEISSVSGSGSGHTYEEVGNNWYRVSFQVTPLSSNMRYVIIPDNTSGSNEKAVLVWGAQLEVGSFPTSYIPTSGSTVTRSGDLPLISGSNFTSWFNDMPFSAYVEYDFQTSAINQRIFSIDTNGYDPRLVVVGSTSSGSGPIVELYSGGTFYTSMNSDITTPTESGTHKLAFAFADNDAANSKDGAAVVTDTTFVFPSNFSQIRLGSQANGNNFMQGTIKKLAFYPKRLPNATLQAMTEA